VIDGVDHHGPLAERPLRGQSGRVWGGYCSARSTAASRGNSHHLAIFHGALLAAERDPMLNRGFLDFVSHSRPAAADFPSPYTADTGSYVYTVFSSDPAGPAIVDVRAGRLVARWNFRAGDPRFRILLQLDGSVWIRNDADLPALDRPGGAGDGPSFNLAELDWERVSADAEQNMNRLDDGGEVPLGPGAAVAADLARVTGMGVVLSRLADGLSSAGVPTSVQLMELRLEGLAAQ